MTEALLYVSQTLYESVATFFRSIPVGRSSDRWSARRFGLLLNLAMIFLLSIWSTQRLTFVFSIPMHLLLLSSQESWSNRSGWRPFSTDNMPGMLSSIISRTKASHAWLVTGKLWRIEYFFCEQQSYQRESTLQIAKPDSLCKMSSAV